MTIIDAATYELQRNGLSHPYVIAFPWVCWTHALILTKYCKADRPSLQARFLLALQMQASMLDRSM
jgi:hypothetical protein